MLKTRLDASDVGTLRGCLPQQDIARVQDEVTSGMCLRGNANVDGSREESLRALGCVTRYTSGSYPCVTPWTGNALPHLLRRSRGESVWPGSRVLS